MTFYKNTKWQQVTGTHLKQKYVEASYVRKCRIL